VEEHLRAAFEMTLGQLLPKLSPVLGPLSQQRFARALERRNFLAHHFWYERIHLMHTLRGINAILAELTDDTELFRELDREVETVMEPLRGRIGLSPESVARVLTEMRRGKAGPLDPLHPQRMLRKQETLVQVFNVPTASGHVLVFQTDDGLLWQLCDAGLGWSPYERVDPAWPLAQKFTALLPVKINPRPTKSAPWSFEIPIGSRAVLSVHPGKRSGHVVCDLRVGPQR
jgi:hypothetical protein